MINQRCREIGVPEEFAPRLHTVWFSRYENMDRERRFELRRVAKTQVDAQVSAAKVEIDREAERQLTQLAEGSLTSEEAHRFLGNMPLPEDVLPPLGSLELPSGEVIDLQEQSEPPRLLSVTDDASVTDERDVTPAHNACRVCGKELPAGRGLYCGPACRQKAYRQRRR